MAKSNDFFVPFFSCYSYLAVTFKLANTSLLKKVTSYSNAVTCNTLLQCPVEKLEREVWEGTVFKLKCLDIQKREIEV